MTYFLAAPLLLWLACRSSAQRHPQRQPGPIEQLFGLLAFLGLIAVGWFIFINVSGHAP